MLLLLLTTLLRSAAHVNRWASSTRRTHQYSPAVAKRGLRYRGTSTKRTRSSCKIKILERLDLRKWEFLMPYTYVHT